jgi:hypothetical protein
VNKEQVAAAERMHEAAWARLAEAAESDPQAKYGLYASRTLAVRHPEVYLWGDAWFADGARTIRGFRESFDDPTALGWPHMEYGGLFFRQSTEYTGVEDGHVLRLADVDLDEYRPANTDRIYPAPLQAHADRRLAPLAVSLKTEGKVVTPLELAEIAYFQRKETGADPRRMFLAACEDESAYLICGDSVWDARRGTAIPSAPRNAVLVWNERSVWHPMMGRDDRASDPELARVVRSVGTSAADHGDDTWESRLAARLQRASALTSDPQRRLAALASVRGCGWRFHPYGRVWQEFVPANDLDIDISRRLGWIRQCDLWANRVSPATAHLFAAQAQGRGLDAQMRALSREHLLRTGVVRDAPARGWKPAWRLESWGHLWPCGLMEHTIDDAFRTRTGHCVSQSHMISAVLEAAGIEHVVVNFDRGGVKAGVNHHFVLSLDGSFLFDDGIVNFRGVDADTEDYGPLLSFSYGEEWASTSGDKLYGNASSQRCIECIEMIERAMANRFPLMFFENEEGRRVLGKRGFIELLAQTEIERVVPT